jgi:hypothetical protein
MRASPPSSAATTVLDHLVEHVRSRDFATDGQQRPASILWTDPKGEWRTALPALQQRMPELIAVGDYAPDKLTGPAIWTRCVVDGALEEPVLPDDRCPVIYLPDASWQSLRAGEECPVALRPLVELVFRGTVWRQENGRDWTVFAFLTSGKTLGLDVAGDRSTAASVLGALSEVLVTPTTRLEGRRLEAVDFDEMLSPDVVRDLLRWLGNPDGERARLGENGWKAFHSRCRERFSFDPDVDADVDAGRGIGLREEQWAEVWQRFADAPDAFPGITELLLRSQPEGVLPFERDSWPAINDDAEDAVRQVLTGVPDLQHSEACDRIADLEEEHGCRRGWVWARLGRSSMAAALEPLSRLASAACSAIGGSTPDEIGNTYKERGWQGDAAAWEALATVSAGDEPIVQGVVRHLLLPWLDESARAFQASVKTTPLPTRDSQPAVEAGDNMCVLFCDGLRYDVGMRLAERLEGHGCHIAVASRWAAAPTVTATGRSAVMPVVDSVVGRALGPDFAPELRPDGKPTTAQNLRAMTESKGYQLLDAGSFDAPMDQQARGWAECGELDSLGHKLEADLARQIPEQLDRIVNRITQLLDQGWETVRVVTDHGWLLVPGGLPKVDLQKHLTASRWARCAVISGESTPDFDRFPWYWNDAESFATAPGVACFNKSPAYAHGGLSVQECLTPDISVTRGETGGARASITSVMWRQLRCVVEGESSGSDVFADLRLARPSGESVVVSPKKLEDGSASLVLAGDEHEDAPLTLVLVDDGGTILAHRSTRAGENA